jgi:hypothetical protein
MIAKNGVASADYRRKRGPHHDHWSGRTGSAVGLARSRFTQVPHRELGGRSMELADAPPNRGKAMIVDCLGIGLRLWSWPPQTPCLVFQSRLNQVGMTTRSASHSEDPSLCFSARSVTGRAPRNLRTKLHGHGLAAGQLMDMLKAAVRLVEFRR